MSEHIQPANIKQALPHSDEAECAVLSAFFMEPAAVGAACATRKIGSLHFYHAWNGPIFTAMMSLWERGSTVDFATVAHEIGAGDVDKTELVTHVHQLVIFPSCIQATDEYLDILHDRFMLRQLRTECQKAGFAALAHDAKGDVVLASLISEIGKLSNNERRKTPSMKELTFDKFRRMKTNEQDTNVIKTGLSKLDQASPLRLGSMPLISGERKAGKSMLAMNIAINIAQAGGRVVYLTLEMPAADLVDRIYAKVAGIPTEAHKMTNLDADQFGKMEWAAAEMAKMPLVIRDDLFDMHPIGAFIRQQKAKYPDLLAVVVDYMQLVRVTLGKDGNREQEVATVSRFLRQISLELKIAILGLVQLNKDGETRESKALEQDCTAMWKLSSPKEDGQGERTLYIPFQRDGESAIGFKLTFIGNLCRIFDYAGSTPYESEEPKKSTRRGHPNERKNK